MIQSSFSDTNESNYKSIIEKKTGNCQVTCQLNSTWQK